MNKTDLIQKIKQLEGFSKDERAYLFNLVTNTKKYGLVWEDKPEAVEELLRESLPVLKEVKEKKILSSELKKIEPELRNAELFELENQTNHHNKSNQGSDTPPNHILIEGDNLHALTALTFTHKGRIDVIYIDPPYNTGNKDFKYNDHFVDKEDSYRHSKWLSFIDKRLRIAKRLLSEKGVIFISIDDNEQAQLKMLCDEVFGQKSFIESIVWKNKYGPGAMTKGFGNIHEYILVYSKQELKSIEADLSDEEIKNYRGKDENFLQRGGYITQPLATKSKDDRPNLVYPVIHKGVEIWPDKQWIWSKERLFEAQSKNFLQINETNDKFSVRFKQYLRNENGEIRKGKPISIFIGPYNQDGTKELENIFGKKIFNNPKPSTLIKKLISMTVNEVENKRIIILDFFAGSGTTLNATMLLNAEDGGNRQCILITSNENNICEEVTYERNKRIIEGYVNTKGEAVAGLTNNNLRYYISEFVPSVKTEKNKRLLTETSTGLLCIKEDCYLDITEENGFKVKDCRIFRGATGKIMIIIYHSRRQLSVCDELIAFIKLLEPLSEAIKIYAFSPEKVSLAEEFNEVAGKIEAIPLPDAIYNAYRNTFRLLKLNKKQMNASMKNIEEVAESQSTLFSDEQEA